MKWHKGIEKYYKKKLVKFLGISFLFTYLFFKNFSQDLRKNISSSSSFKNKSLKMYSGVKSISSDSYFHTIDEKSILHENDFNNSSNTCCNCCTIL